MIARLIGSRLSAILLGSISFIISARGAGAAYCLAGAPYWGAPYACWGAP